MMDDETGSDEEGTNKNGISFQFMFQLTSFGTRLNIKH